MHNQQNSYQLDELLPMEREVLRYCCSELVYKEIGERLHIKHRTVHAHVDSLFKKLHVRSRHGLIIVAMEMGIEPPRV